MDNLKTKRAATEQILTPGEADVNDPAGWRLHTPAIHFRLRPGKSSCWIFYPP
ncbi:MAG: hypothetical protein R3C20_04745 [Planctomycetaceae bacterium]